MSLSESPSVRIVRDPVIDRPEDDDGFEPREGAPESEPSAEDLSWWQIQVAAAEARAVEASPLAAWLRAQAHCYRAGGARPGSHAAWLAARLDGLAGLAEFLNARTGDVLDDREEVLGRADRA
jgi:hypothetical protein